MDSDDSFTTAVDGFPESEKRAQISHSDYDPVYNKLNPRLMATPSSKRHFRTAKSLPYELINHAFVYFDGQSYLEAFSLLTTLLEAGTSISTPTTSLPAFIPPPQQIALSATLIVHPDTTTRTNSRELQRASNEALKYLRALNRTVGPVNTQLASVFSFNDERTARRGERPRGPVADADESDEEGEATRITTRIANRGSVFTQAANFWHVVGWALNCSVNCKRRWERWKHFLELMFEILEDDWDERTRAHNELIDDGKDPIEAADVVLDGMICKYLKTASADTRQGRRKILRAIFADGTPKSTGEFGEVWKDESKEPKNEELNDPSKKRKINVEEGDFGDYDLDEDQGDEEKTPMASYHTGRQSKRQQISNPINCVDNESLMDVDPTDLKGSDVLGGIDSLLLRQRLLAFLAKTTLLISQQGFTSRDDLFDTFTEFYRQVPISLFMQLLSTSQMPTDGQRHLNMNILVPHLATYPPKSVTLHDPSLEDLQEHLLPYTAKTNGVADNVRVSLLLEWLLADAMQQAASEPATKQTMTDMLKSGSLRKAVESGVKAREERAIGDARRKGKGMEGQEGEYKQVLKSSGKRLLLLVKVLEMGTLPSKPETPLLNLDVDMSDSSLSGISSSAPSDLSSPINDNDDSIMNDN